MSHLPKVRALLRQSDGMTASEIAEALDVLPSVIHRSLHAMPDAYIDRWAKTNGNPGHYGAVWCVVVPPENCPKPNA
jgi:predicted transcriptional regulator